MKLKLQQTIVLRTNMHLLRQIVQSRVLQVKEVIKCKIKLKLKMK